MTNGPSPTSDPTRHTRAEYDDDELEPLDAETIVDDAIELFTAPDDDSPAADSDVQAPG